MVIDLISEELAYWILKKMQSKKKHANHIIPWFLVSVIAKMKESAGSDPDARPSSDFGQPELPPLSAKLPAKGRNMPEQQK